MAEASRYILNRRSIVELSSYLKMMQTEWFSENFASFNRDELMKASPIIKETFAEVLGEFETKQTLRETELISMWSEALTKSWDKSTANPSQTLISWEKLNESITESALKSIFKLFANDQRLLGAGHSRG